MPIPSVVLTRDPAYVLSPYDVGDFYSTPDRTLDLLYVCTRAEHHRTNILEDKLSRKDQLLHLKSSHLRL